MIAFIVRPELSDCEWEFFELNKVHEGVMW